MMDDSAQGAVAPPAPPAERIARDETGFAFVTLSDVPLVLVRAKREERAILRYQIYQKSNVRVVVLASDETPPVPRIECRWKLTAHLQRQLCFESITGYVACSDSTLTDLPDDEHGQQAVAAGDVDACTLALPGVAQAKQRFADALRASGEARFESDYSRNVLPVLDKTGVVVRRSATK